MVQRMGVLEASCAEGPHASVVGWSLLPWRSSVDPFCEA